MGNPFCRVLFMCFVAFCCAVAYAVMALYAGYLVHFVVGVGISMVICGLFGWSACRCYDFKQYQRFRESFERQKQMTRQMEIVNNAEKPFKEFDNE